MRILTVAMLGFPRVVHAHPGRAPEPHDLWHAWSFEPLVILLLLLSAAMYIAGMRRLIVRAGPGRGISTLRIAAFAAGQLALALALLSPIDAVSAALFSIHMVQHLLLVIVAAPLLVLGQPLYVMMWALGLDARRGVAAWWNRGRVLQVAWRALSHPVVAWSLHVVALWIWHAPRLYDWALGDERIHVLEHSTFLLTALLFWWVVLDRHRLRVGAATFYLFTAALQSTMLGALLTMVKHPWYAAHLTTTAAWGLTPLEDQQLAGLIMWIPAGAVYLIALAPRLLRVLTETGARSVRRSGRVSRRSRADGA
ncbi:MAG: cytochrome c oxidase assembly protein [Gemmatimonadota bacterium]|nr:cytochrome c oxidase assembly protein [Gemmatimonadota bacterium]